MSKVKSHIPYYKVPGTHSHEYRWEDFTDIKNNRMKLKYCTYRTKKDELCETVIQVIHLE